MSWCIVFPEGAAKGDLKLPPGRIYASTRLWQASDLDAKMLALTRLQMSMGQLEAALGEWQQGEGLSGLLNQLAEIRRLDERIVSLEQVLPGEEVVQVPASADDEEVVVAREGSLSVKRERRSLGPAAFLSRLLSSDGDAVASEYEQIGTFSLRPLSTEEEEDALGVNRDCAQD